MKPLAFLAFSTALVLALLQACSSANPHPAPLEDCTSPNCTVKKVYPDVIIDTSTTDTSAADTSLSDTSVVDTSVVDTSVVDTSVVDAAQDG